MEARSPGLSPKAATALMLFATLVLGLAGLGIWAGLAITRLPGVPTVRCAPEVGEVMVSVGGRVFVTDESGATLRVLEGPFEDVGDIDRLESGGYLVSEDYTSKVHEYDPSGAEVAEHLVPDLPDKTFGLQPLPDGRYVFAHTETQRLTLRDSAFEVLGELPASAPDADVHAWGPNVYGTMDVHERQPLLFDDELRDLAPPPGSGLAAFVALGLPRANLRQVVPDPRGHAVLVACQNGAGDQCALLRMAPGATKYEFVGGLQQGTDLPTTDWSRQLRAITGACVTSSGAIVVASERYTTLVRFSDGDGGAPGKALSADEGLNEVALQVGQTLGPTNTVDYFGDDQLTTAVDSVALARRSFDRIERLSRVGLYALLVVLLLLWGFDRWLGASRPDGSAAEAVSKRAQLIWDELIRGDRALRVYLGTIFAVFAGAAAAGYLLGGFATAALLGLGISKTLGRRLSAPRLLRERSPNIAERAFQIHLGREAARFCVLVRGETVIRAWYEMPEVDATRDDLLEQVTGELIDEPDDPSDLLDVFSPPFVMVVVTNRRILRYTCGLLGRPQRPIRVYQRPDAPARPGIPPWPEVASAICHQCGRRIRPGAACSHQDSTGAWPLLAGALFPGAGHLVLGDLNRGRFLMMVFTTLALDLAATLLNLTFANVAATPSYWLRPLLPLVAFWLVAFLDLQRTVSERRELMDELEWARS